MKTRVLGKLIKRVVNEKDHIEVTFEIKDWNYKKFVKELEPDEYVIEVFKPRAKRSNNQNALLWELIHLITEYEQGIGGDEWFTYTSLLEMANCKYEYMVLTDEAAKALKEVYRTIKNVGKRTVINEETGEATEANVYKCFIGSSKFTIDEMNHLIDIAIRYANEIGMDTKTL